MSAAIYMKRANLNILLITKGYGTLEKAGKIENYYGINEISGINLHESGIEQVKNLGVECINDEVVRAY